MAAGLRRIEKRDAVHLLENPRDKRPCLGGIWKGIQRATVEQHRTSRSELNQPQIARRQQRAASTSGSVEHGLIVPPQAHEITDVGQRGRWTYEGDDSCDAHGAD